MTGARYAILIASSDFPEEPKLQPLRCPARDVDGLGAVLSSNEFGDFADVKILKNRPHFEILDQVSSIFHRAGRDGLVLFYYSGHGRQDREGQLYLATSNTRLVTTHSLAVTSIPIETLKKIITESDTTKVAIILDCCYSGAIEGAFLKGNADSELQPISRARGTYILTASTALQAAIEKEGDEYGLLTKHIIEGIRNGEADLDKDGLISMDDLYDYVYERVPREGTQEPMKWALNVKGKSIIIARAGQDMQIRAQIEVLLNEAKRFAQKEFWELAVKSLRTIQALSPNHHEALSLLKVAEQQIEVASLYNEGVTHYDHSRWAAALDCFQAIHRRVGNYRDLAILVKKVEAGLDRQKIPIFYKEAKIAMSGEEWDVAIEKLQGILSIDSENQDALSLLARVQNERELSQLYAEGNRHYSAREWSKAWASFNKIREKAADYKATNVLLGDLTEKITAENARWQAQVEAANEEAMQILVTAQGSGKIHDWVRAIERLKLLIEANPNHKQVRAKLVYANRRLLEAEQNKTFDGIYAEGEQYYERGLWGPALVCFLIVWDGLGSHRDVSQRVVELGLRNARSFILKWDVTSTIAGVSFLLSVVILKLWWEGVAPQVSSLFFVLTSIVLIGSAYRFYQLTKWSDTWFGERFRLKR
ncbi:MAG TPA: caspase family protein, partial [Anaerolineales bacterium]|nr:caspase family protein [Anaerolineales bacterium]